MKAFVGVSVLLVACGVATAQTAVHDNGHSVTGAPLQGVAGVHPGNSPRGGGIVYDRSIETGFRATAGTAGFLANAPADPTRALFDDVPVPGATLGTNTMLDVSRVTVGIRRLANAGATDVNVFWSTMTTTVVAPDTQLDTPPSVLGSVSLPANGAAAVTELVTFGSSGGPTLFSVPLNMDMFAGFGTFSIGVALSSTDGTNGWRITNGPSGNANVFWLYDPNNTASPNTEGAFLFNSADPPNPPASFYIIVEGTPVPTPAGVAMLGVAGVFAGRRRRK